MMPRREFTAVRASWSARSSRPPSTARCSMATTKSFIVSYDGVIKAGVDLDRLQVTVGDEEITVTLPESRIISHEIPEDSLEVFDESDNLFNHITIEDYTAFTRDQKSAMEQRAVDGGLFQSGPCWCSSRRQ